MIRDMKKRISKPRSPLHTIWMSTVGVLSAGLIFLAVLLTVVQFVVARIPQYKSELEKQLSIRLGYQVEVAEIEAQLRRYNLEIVLKSPRILDERRDQVLYDPAEIALSLNLVRTLVHRHWVFDSLTLKDLNLIVERFPDGRLKWHGLPGDGQVSASSVSWQEALKPWLARLPGVVWIKDSSLLVHDRQENRTFHFSSINLGVTSVEKAPVVAGSLTLDPSLGKRLRFRIEPHFLLGMGGQKWGLYVQGEQLLPAAWPWLVHFQDWPDVRSGLVDIEAWLSFDGQRLAEIQGRFNGVDVAIQPPGVSLDEPVSFQRLRADFGFARHDMGWVAQFEQVSLSRQQREWQTDSLLVWHDYPRVLPSLEEEQRYGLAIGFVRIEDLVQIARMIPQTPVVLLEQLDIWQPSGDFQDVKGQFRWVDGKVESYSVETKVDRVSMQWKGHLIRLDRIGAHLFAKDSGGEIRLNGQYGEIAVTALFEEVLPFDFVHGTLSWQYAGDDWSVSSSGWAIGNQDLVLEGDLMVQSSAQSGQGPVMRLNGVLDSIRVDALSHYYPTGIMPPETLAWLRQSLAGGRVTHAGVVFDGALNDFPFAQGEGIFQVDASVQGVMLNYHPDWPGLENIDGTLRFTGTGMEINATRGRYQSYVIHPTKVSLSSYLKPVLAVSASGNGPASTLTTFLRRTPLEFPKESLFNNLIIDGDSQLKLGLEIPLDSALKLSEKVNGRVTLESCRVAQSGWNGVADEFSGVFEFDENGVLPGKLSGMYQGHPLTVEIENRPLSPNFRNRNTLINVVFTGNPLNWLDVSWAPVQALATGESVWNTSILIGAQRGKHVPVQVEAVSNLQGISLALPEPLHKANPATRLPARIKVDVAENELTVDAVVGNSLAVVAEFGRNDGGRFRRGEIRFGGGLGRLPQVHELALFGQVPALNLDAWHSFIDFLPQSLTHDRRLPALRLGMAVKRLTLQGRDYDDLALTLTHHANQYEMVIRGDDVSGRVRFQHPDFEHGVLKIELDRFRYEPGSETVDELRSTQQQQMWPRVELSIDHLLYRDYDAGRLTLLAVPESQESLRIEHLDLRGRELTLEATGRWHPFLSQAKGARTEIQGSYQWRNLNAILSGVGYPDVMAAERGEGRFALFWAGELFDPRLESLEGSLNIDLMNGNLYNVEPGAGRLVGLLSMSQIFRRISLDFRDFFAEGLKFDRMQGALTLAGGNAQVDSFAIDGPSVFIDISGRLGLANRDYDQWVTVTPKTSDTLPLIGGLVAGNPAVGLSILVLQRLFKQQLDQITQYSYHVTGPWESPVFTRKEPSS